MTLDEFVNEELKQVAAFKQHNLEQRQEILNGGATEQEVNEIWPLEMDEEDWAEALYYFEWRSKENEG